MRNEFMKKKKKKETEPERRVYRCPETSDLWREFDHLAELGVKTVRKKKTRARRKSKE